MYKNRPTPKELNKKLADAKVAIDGGNVRFVSLAKLFGEITALGLGGPEDVWPLIRDLLDEVDPEDYAGSRPPRRSYEAAVKDRELFAFCWDSEKLEKRMYLKFVIAEGTLFYVSLHQSMVEQ